MTTEKKETTKQLWLRAPAGQLSEACISIIERWDDNPTALQYLELLDMATFEGGASDFVMSVLPDFLSLRLREEGKSYSEVVAEATWRELQ